MQNLLDICRAIFSMWKHGKNLIQYNYFTHGVYGHIEMPNLNLIHQAVFQVLPINKENI